jgi:hypothetical protein
MPKSFFFLLVPLVLILTILLSNPAKSQSTWSVWTETLIIDKVRPSYDPPVKNTSITIKGAKGEWLAFYVVMKGNENISGFVPSVQSTLTNGANTIPDSNWDFYMVQYVNTTVSTYTGGSAGEWPDPCVPYHDRFFGETRNGTEQGWGKTVSDGDTQPFLFEIYIPQDAVAGIYTGTARIAAIGNVSDAVIQDITVSLEVWNFTLPVTWSYGSIFGFSRYSGVQGAWTRADYKYAHDMFAKSAVDHGMWLYGGDSYTDPTVNTTTGAINFEDGNFNDEMSCGSNGCEWGYKKWLDGTVPNVGYSPRPYLGFRPKIFEMRTTAGNPWIALNHNSTKLDKYFDDLDAFIDTNGYGTYTKFVSKIIDEAKPPACCSTTVSTDSDMAMTGGRTNRTYFWPYQTIGVAGCGPNDCPTLNNKSYHLGWTNLNINGFIRPLVPQAGNYPRSAFDDRLADKGDLLLIYSAESSKQDYNGNQTEANAMDSWFIDTIVGGRENAAGPLSMWQFNVSGFHYWQTVMCFNNMNWNDSDCGYANTNGDGFTWYFGKTSSVNENDIGGIHDIPIESLRMKLWRYGMNILEYAKLLEAAGKTSIANTQISNMINYSESGNAWGSVSAWESARESMAMEILSGNTSCIHKSDSNCDGCVDMNELTAFINRWNVNNQDVTLKELMEAIGYWNRGS